MHIENYLKKAMAIENPNERLARLEKIIPEFGWNSPTKDQMIEEARKLREQGYGNKNTSLKDKYNNNQLKELAYMFLESIMGKVWEDYSEKQWNRMENEIVEDIDNIIDDNTLIEMKMYYPEGIVFIKEWV